VTGLTNICENAVDYFYSDCLEEETKYYKKQRPLHTQFRCKYCKKLGRIFRRKDCKEPEDISGEICLYIDEMDVEGDITVNVGR